MKVLALSGIGKRELNEDAYGYVFSGQLLCAVVCDGVGGYDLGEVASKMVKDSILEAFEKNPTNDIGVIRAYIRNAANNLLEYKNSINNQSNMFTTLSMVICDCEKAMVAYVGDSRVQIYSDYKLSFRTLDHSMVERMLQNGEITEKQARHHEERNKLTRALGMKDDIDTLLTIQQVELDKDVENIIVISSDGFWENINEKQFGRILRWNKSNDKVLEKAENRLKRSKFYSDNYTAIVINANKE